MRFIRKGGRIIPIRDEGFNKEEVKGIATMSAGTGIAGSAMAKKGIQGNGFNVNVYKAGGFKLFTSNDGKSILPKSFAVTGKTKMGAERVHYVSSSLGQYRKGWGKKILAAVQFNAAHEGKSRISGLMVSTDSLRFLKTEKSKFFSKGRPVDFVSAKKIIARGGTLNSVSRINLANKAYADLGMKMVKRPNRLGLFLGTGLVGLGLAKYKGARK